MTSHPSAQDLSTSSPSLAGRLPARPRLRADVVLDENRGRVDVRMGLHEVAVLAPADREVANWLTGIDGSRRLPEVVASTPPLIGGSKDAVAVLQRLDRLGAFDDDAVAIPAELPASRAPRLVPTRRELAAGRGTHAAAAVLAARARATVAVYGGQRLGRQCAEALADLGVGSVRRFDHQMTGNSPSADLHLIFAGLGMSGGANLCNDAALVSGAAHVAVEVGSETAAVCPVRIVGSSGCAGCLNLWRADRGLVTAELLHTWRGRSPAPLSAITEPLLVSIVLSTTSATLDSVLLDDLEADGCEVVECDLLDRSSTTTQLPVHPRCRCSYAHRDAA